MNQLFKKRLNRRKVHWNIEKIQNNTFKLGRSIEPINLGNLTYDTSNHIAPESCTKVS